MLERDVQFDPRVSYGGLRRYADNLGITVCSELLPEGLQGFYCENVQTIIIDRSMTYTQKRCTLAHELMHWKHMDLACSEDIHTKQEHRARKEAATMLINPIEYATLETAYEGGIYLIADDLDVTKQVVEDYRKLVLYRRQYA